MKGKQSMSRLAFRSLGLAPILGLALAACSPLEYLKETQSLDTTGAFQLADRDVAEPIDLGRLLYSYAPNVREAKPGCAEVADDKVLAAKSGSGVLGGGADAGASAAKEPERERLDKALAYFNCRAGKALDNDRLRRSAGDQLGSAELARNGLQERLMAASQHRCNAFTANLQRTFSRNNFGLGVLTTLAGTAGALVSSTGAANNWSGAAAVFSGTRAEFNQDFMANLAAHVIVDGIEKRRKAVYDAIQSRGQGLSYASYSVEAAIKDAIYYHGQCTVIAGFQEASDAIKYANDPGLGAALDTATRVRAANLLFQNTNVTPEELLKRSQGFVRTRPMLVGSLLSAESKPVSTLTVSAEAMDRIAAAAKGLQAAAGAMQADADVDDAAKKSSGIADLKVGGDPLATAGIGDKCRKATETYYLDEQKKLTEAGVTTDSAKRRDASADALAAASKGRYLGERLGALAAQYTAAGEDTLERWQRAFAKLKKKEAGADSVLKKELAVPALDAALVAELKTLCP